MKVLQIIDSLEAGGAERMAVQIANGLTKKGIASYICVTRKEGALKEQLNRNIPYVFLHKKRTIDFKALQQLKQFVKKEHITIVHAHSSSVFIAIQLKILFPAVKIVWHDHYGNAELEKRKHQSLLSLVSSYIDACIVVNKKLLQWNKEYLSISKINYLENFAATSEVEKQVTKLLGVSGKRIVCLANLRPQKDHLTLLKAFKECYNTDWTLHLVGKDFHDDYSQSVKEYIVAHELTGSVFLYGSCNDTQHILQQATIGVLSSASEGLPLALLEYGQAGLPVIVTDVGDCKAVVGNCGIVVAAQNVQLMRKAFVRFMNDAEDRRHLAEKFHERVEQNYGEASYIRHLIHIYESV
ncbi:glycosyltransferase [Zhouia sp. PK063]|uniref:glycosyltransferase n=1 Tax=Zhouia sp. PK063 TaxID=3373602 RepID=UPI00379073EF